MSDVLFQGGFLSEVLRARVAQMESKSKELPADHVLATGVEDLTAELVTEYAIAPIVLEWDAMTASQSERKVDVSGDFRRAIFDRSQPFYLVGTSVAYHIPFEGEADLFKYCPSSFTSMAVHGRIAGGEVILEKTLVEPTPEQMKGEFDAELARLRQYVTSVDTDVEAFNRTLPTQAARAAQARRDKVLHDKELVASLGVPLRRREDATPTFATLSVRRRSPVSRPVPTRGASPRAPEPVVTAEEYAHILRIIADTGRGFEHSPRTVAGASEEVVRDLFLIQLNGHYEGQATGETFNVGGKTDILIRDRERTVFIAECKFWDGPKTLVEAIDQILDYTSWRDTKTAILLFNRTRNLSTVLSQVVPVVSQHPNHVRTLAPHGETEFPFVLHHRDDPERELSLTVLVFEVPDQQAAT